MRRVPMTMFWKKEEPKVESVREKVQVAVRQEDPETAAIDALAALLRSLGRHSFDLDDLPRGEVEQRFEKWAMRLTIGESKQDEEGRPSSRRGIQRDFGGVKRFVEMHRKEEHDYVTAGFENLRQAVRVFMQTTTSTLREEREATHLMGTELDSLDQALAVNDHEAIRRAAENTARRAREQIERRRGREQELIEALQKSITDLRAELDEARKAATIDALTQVYNRSSLDIHLRGVCDQAFLSGKTACVVMVDIDHFKVINDSYGHPAGDEVLRQVADSIVRGFLRREDFVARYGGEEFCIVAEHTSFETTRERVERLRKSIEELKIDAFGKKIQVSVSFGIAALEPGENAKSWITRADHALYRAKQKGRNRISIAPPEFGVESFEAGHTPSSRPLGAVPDVVIIHEASHPESPAQDPGPPNKPPPRAISALLGNRSS